MRRQDRQILLLLDNASSHPADVELSNVALSFLPPNTTSHLQPLDSGIIKCFKSHYRKLQLQHIVEMMDADSEPDLNLKQAVHFIRAAWHNVSPVVIQNCWAHAGLIKTDSLVASPTSNESVSSAISAQASDVQVILMKLPAAGSLLSAAEYIDIDATEPTEQEMSDDEIVQAVFFEAGKSDEVGEDEGEEEEELDPPPPPSLRDAQQAMTVVFRYFECNTNTTVDEMDTVMNVQKLLKDRAMKKFCYQSKITGYFAQ